MKFAFYTLGCKVNQYETQAMEQLLKTMGHEIRGLEESCDGYIINTCSVTAVADKKNRAVIRRCQKANPQAVVAVCGCYPQPDAAAAPKAGITGVPTLTAINAGTASPARPEPASGPEPAASEQPHVSPFA